VMIAMPSSRSSSVTATIVRPTSCSERSDTSRPYQRGALFLYAIS
jgi:hypothetical protein